VGVEGADHPAASVEPDERPVLATRWAVRAHTYACRGDLLDLLDLVESTEEADPALLSTSCRALSTPSS
jgi:hypothetical protein